MTKHIDKQTKPADFANKIRDMFDIIANRYDLANHLLSAGTDYRWRRLAVKFTRCQRDDVLLDICCGTGDLVFCYVKYGKITKATGCDFSEEMIGLAGRKQQKLAKKGKLGLAELYWKAADCTATSYPDESYDIISCGFGIRNMADFQAALKEMHRLLKPGGRACILEFSLPKCRIFKTAYLVYLRYILPVLGGIVLGKMYPYRYFADSILKWDKEVNLETALESANLEKVTVQPLSKGIATIYIYKKP